MWSPEWRGTGLRLGAAPGRVAGLWAATILLGREFLGNRVGMQFVELALILGIVVLLAAVAAMAMQAPIKAVFKAAADCLTDAATC